MSGYSDHWASHLRLAVLRLLAEANEYRTNASILTDLVASLGIVASRAQVRTEIAWLEEQGLVTTVEPMPGLIVATATERGLDAAAGRARLPGVARPSPKPF